MSNRARQLNRDVVETPLWSDNKVVNVAASVVTTPPIRSGPCSGMRGASMRCTWAKRTSGAWSSGTESVKAESVAVLGVGRRGVRVKAKVSDRIYLEDRIAGIIPGNRDFRGGVTERRGGVPAKYFSGVL